MSFTILQAKLWALVNKKFPKLGNCDKHIIESVITKIKSMGQLNYIKVEDIDLDAEFNDIIYPTDNGSYVVPPVSYFDTKQHYWTSRKAGLVEKYGYMGKTKDNVLADGLMAKINKGASFFNPVLCEIIIAWFNTFGGRIFNPFCGEASIGLIASAMGCEFVGIDIRQEQVDVNNNYILKANINPKPIFLCGNSLELDKVLSNNNLLENFDLIFSSPPYYDLEIYSDGEGDISAKQSYGDFIKDYTLIFNKAIQKLNRNRFLVVKVGEITDEQGVYRNFVGDNIRIFNELGLKYYNEIILLNQFGTAPMRFNQNFKTRKIVKIHQNILVFFKGNISNIPNIYKQQNKLKGFGERQQTLWK